jgi:hypothetical protein
MAEQKIIQGSLFEQDYLLRSLSGGIVSQPDTALTELVANAWDAGANHVNIFIPDKIGDQLVVEDDGTGLTKEDFYQRWMKLRYNRVSHQGKEVVFPDGKRHNRLAYGRNGVGRHGLLCFNDEYLVQTTKDGTQLSLMVSTKVDGQPIAITDKKEEVKDGHGTRLEVVVAKNLPSIEKVREIISSRFLHDPQFVIEINREVLPLDKLDGLIDTSELTTKDGLKIKANFIDTKTSSKKSIYQGIAFWQRRRLVGTPSWTLGYIYYVDGRSTMARRYNVVIQSEDLDDIIKEDWSGFKDSEVTNNLYETVKDYVAGMFEKVAKANVDETRTIVKAELKSKLIGASPLALYEVDEVIENIIIGNPTATKESISLAAEAVVNLESSKNGRELLAKLSKLSEDDVAGLNEILSKWSVKDALTVLSEIDRRMSIIEAVRKLSKDKTTDELHVLHPLITESRWLFGPEYDTAEYTSNRQLQTVIKTLFNGKIKDDHGVNLKKRPDLVILADDFTVSVTGTEDFSSETGLVSVNKVLIIELKRGGFEIGREERTQASNYIEDLMASDINASSYNAFVIGDSVATNVQRHSTVGNSGNIYVTTFSQLVDTAERRMFGLRDKLSAMYDDVPGMELYLQTKMTLG